MKKVFAHGAVNAVKKVKFRDYPGVTKEWIYFGATIGDEAYPVCFELKEIPKLIEWLQAQLPKKNKS